MKTKKHERTIAPELFAMWEQCRKPNDIPVLAKLLKVSGPTISKALNYGHVNQDRLVDGITKYFQTRLEKENAQATKLKQLQHQAQVLS